MFTGSPRTSWTPGPRGKGQVKGIQKSLKLSLVIFPIFEGSEWIAWPKRTERGEGACVYWSSNNSPVNFDAGTFEFPSVKMTSVSPLSSFILSQGEIGRPGSKVSHPSPPDYVIHLHLSTCPWRSGSVCRPTSPPHRPLM